MKAGANSIARHGPAWSTSSFCRAIFRNGWSAFFQAPNRRIPDCGSCRRRRLGLSDLGADERVRADFYALISPLAIEMPPLSRRPEDLPPLAQHFLEELNRQEPKQVGGFDEQVWPLLDALRLAGKSG